MNSKALHSEDKSGIEVPDFSFEKYKRSQRGRNVAELDLLREYTELIKDKEIKKEIS